mmetsp:Transcript_6205/g.25082  ORF Transcript_6205/g.25082 Transcript_6205/m.25082 type:complete len:474 (+) Transcript_6205:3243-4664(+)
MWFRGGSVGGTRPPHSSGTVQWQLDLEAGALARFAADAQCAVQQLGHGRVRAMQAQPRAALAEPRREEGLEDAAQVGRCNAGAVVLDLQAGPARFSLAQPDRDLPAAAAGDAMGPGVVDQQAQHLGQRLLVDTGRQAAGQFHRPVHTGIQPGPDHLDRVSHEGREVNIGQCMAGALGPCQRLEALDQMPGPVQRAVHHRRVLADLADELLDLTAPQRRRLQQAAKPVALFEDQAGREPGIADGCVELMRHARGHLAQGGQLLALHQVLHGLLQLGGALAHPVVELVMGLLQRCLGGAAHLDLRLQPAHGRGQLGRALGDAGLQPTGLALGRELLGFEPGAAHQGGHRLAEHLRLLAAALLGQLQQFLRGRDGAVVAAGLDGGLHQAGQPGDQAGAGLQMAAPDLDDTLEQRQRGCRIAALPDQQRLGLVEPEPPVVGAGLERRDLGASVQMAPPFVEVAGPGTAVGQVHQQHA